VLLPLAMGSAQQMSEPFSLTLRQAIEVALAKNLCAKLRWQTRRHPLPAFVRRVHSSCLI